jgi:hypothetical protein
LVSDTHEGVVEYTEEATLCARLSYHHKHTCTPIKPEQPNLPPPTPPPGRGLSYQLAKVSRRWRKDDIGKMPTAMGDIREIAGQPVFVPLYTLFQAYGEMFVLAIGPKKFVVVSDNEVAKEMLLTKANSFSKGEAYFSIAAFRLPDRPDYPDCLLILVTLNGVLW